MSFSNAGIIMQISRNRPCYTVLVIVKFVEEYSLFHCCLTSNYFLVCLTISATYYFVLTRDNVEQ